MPKVKNQRVRRDESRSRGLLLIAVFKLVKAVTLLAVGIGALKLLHKNIALELQQWVDFFRVDPENFLIHRLIAKLSILTDRRLKELSLGTFFYSALLFTEGIGLALCKRWAEYFTTIITASLIPLELWEIVKRATTARLVVLFINVVIVIYLAIEIRRHRKTAE